jgi:DNA-binding MarR family transcriptional regulator
MASSKKAKTARLSRLAAGECLNFNLRKADRVVSQAFDKAIAGSGLKSTQFMLLNGVARTDGAGISALAEAMVMDRTTLSRNLAPLERDGLIAVVPGEDRRTRTVEITAKGRRVLEKTLPLWHTAQRRLTRAIGAGEATRLLEQLRAVVGAAGY